jgi:hypothetical protein
MDMARYMARMLALPVLPNRILHGILTVTAVSVSMCVTHDVRMFATSS